MTDLTYARPHSRELIDKQKASLDLLNKSITSLDNYQYGYINYLKHYKHYDRLVTNNLICELSRHPAILISYNLA